MEQEFESFLDDISVCFTRRDADLWRSRIWLPFSIVTKKGVTALPTEDAVFRNFRHYLTAMDVMALDLVDRHAVSLEDCRDGTWLGTFQTRLVSQGALATAPYTSTALLQIYEDRFRMSSMLNGRGHTEWTGIVEG